MTALSQMNIAGRRWKAAGSGVRNSSCGTGGRELLQMLLCTVALRVQCTQKTRTFHKQMFSAFAGFLTSYISINDAFQMENTIHLVRDLVWDPRADICHLFRLRLCNIFALKCLKITVLFLYVCVSLWVVFLHYPKCFQQYSKRNLSFYSRLPASHFWMTHSNLVANFWGNNKQSEEGSWQPATEAV